MGVFAQRYDADDAPLGPEFRANVIEDGKQYHPSVAMLATGGFAIAFHTAPADSDERDYEVEVREFDGSGEGLGDEYRMNDYTDNGQRMVRIAAGPSGFFGVWESYGQDGDAYGVYARSYDSAYGLSPTEFQMNASGDRWQYAPAVAAAADGRFVAAWHENDGMGSFWIRTRVFSP